MAAILMTAILMTALALPATADAQVERKCRPVAGGPWKATGISVYNVNCRSARAKLRRWLRADRRPLLPRNPDGWQCGRYSLPGSQANRQCRSYPYGNDTAVGFVLRLQRRQAASASAAGTPCGRLAEGGWKASDIRATHLTCGSARAKLRRWLPPPLPSNPLGWNCFPFRVRRMCAVGQGDAPRFTFRLERRPRATVAAATAPCSYEERIIEVSDSTVNLGVDVGAAIDNAEDKTDGQLARQFTSFGQRLRRIERRTAALSPLDALASQHAAFRAAVRPVRRALFGIGRAARGHNFQAARTWTMRLIEDSSALRKSRRALVRRARARVSDGRCA